MKRSIKRYLAFFMAFAMLAAYSFSPQNLTAFAISGVEMKDVQQTAAQEQQTDSTEAADTEQTPTDQATEGEDTPSDEGTQTEETEAAGDETQPAAEEDSYPEASFTESAGGVTVNIKAPKGALPEGATVKVAAVKAGVIQEAVDELIDDGTVIKAVDITFYNKDGEQIEPEKEVSVSFESKKFAGLNNPSVVHITDEGNAERVNGSKVNTNKKEATFESDEFSIYAIVDEGDDARLLVKFMKGSEEITSMYVKKGDDMETVLYDPGAGELAGGVVFKGWTTKSDYDSGDIAEGKTISQVRAAVTQQLADGVHDGDTVTYYAMLFKQYQVKYLDESGAALGVANVTGRADSQAEYESYTVNMAYTPKDDEHNFAGWNVKSGGDNIQGYTAGTVYENETEINIKGDVTFSVNAPAGHWLVFNENGKNATYNAPQFVESGHVTQEPPLAMVRNGYTFGGWYRNADCSPGQEFTFGRTLSDNTTIYAKWTPDRTAYYTVIIWKQNVAGDDYDFEESIRLQGNVGTTINTVTSHDTGDNRYARINGTNYRYTGFHLDRFDQNVTIKAEGNSVLNVYYDRNQYKLTFQVRTGSGWGARWTTVKEIEGLYEQNIGSNFPIVGSGGTVYDNGERWDPQDNNVGLNEVIVYLDVMPAGDVTFHLDTANRPLKTINWYVEALPGQGGVSAPATLYDYDNQSVTTPTGMKFVLYNSINARYNGVTKEDYIDLLGYDRLGSDSQRDNSGYYIYDTTHDGTINFYYTRSTYKLNFMDGKYFDGNGNPIEEPSRGQLHEVDDIEYGANIVEEGKYEPEATPGYAFDGWYLDDACTHPYTFGTMPSNNVTVHARWILTQYRVFLHPNAGTDPTLDWGSDDVQMNFRVSNGGNVSTPTGTRTGYEFVGWYSDPACTHVFNSATVLNDETVTAAYDKNVDMTDPMDKWGNGATYNADTNRFWITKKLDLYGKWRATLDGADGIGIIYDANGGSNPPSDTTLYVDNSDATAGAASTAPAGKIFKHWVIQHYNTETGTYDDTTKIVEPGQSFAVLKDDAKVEEIQPDPEHPDVTKSYTVKLRAEYGTPEESTPTHIAWYKNDGTAAFHTDTTGEGGEPLQINEAVDIQAAQTRDDYTFLGWARVTETDDMPLTQDLTEDDIYLFYNSDGDGSFHLNSTTGKTVTKVAADEDDPYQAMFAVWKPKLKVRITGNTDTKEYNGSQQSVTGYTVEYKVPGGEWTTTAPQGVSVSLKPGESATASGTNVGTYDMGLTKDKFTVNPGNYSFDPQSDFHITDGWLEITKPNVTITITGHTDSKVYNGAEQSVTGYDVSIPAGVSITQSDVIFSGNAEAKGTNVGTYPMNLAASQFSVTEAVSNNYNVTFAVTDGSLEITKLNVTVDITGNNDTKVYNGSEQNVTGYTAEASSPLYVVSGDNKDFTFTGSAEAKGTNVGTYPMELNANQFTNTNENFNVSFNIKEDGFLEITPLEVAVKIKGNTGSKVYSGSEQNVTGYEVTEISDDRYTENDFTFSGNQTAKGTDVGTYPMGLTENQFTNTNSNFTVNFVITDGSLEITPLDVTVEITGHTDTEAYDGQPHTVTGYDVTSISSPLYTASDFTFSGEATATRTQKGETPMGLSESQFTNNNNNFNVTFSITDGKMVITPPEKVVVTITGQKLEADYNGEPHTASGYTVEISNPLYTEADFTFSGTAEATRTIVGKTDMGLAPNKFTNINENFDDVEFVVNDGSMTIKPIEVTVTITGNTDTKAYDGQPHTVTNYNIKADSDLYNYNQNVTFTPDEHITLIDGKPSATRTDVGTTHMNLAVSQFANTDSNFNVTFVVNDGYQTINAVDVIVTIVGENSTDPYDGASHTVTGYTAKSSNPLYKVSGEDIDFTFSGTATATRTDVGKTDMGLTPGQFQNTNPNFGNVTFNVTDGYQEITPIDVTVTIKGHTNTTDYDGAEHTVSGYDVETSTPLYTAADFAFSGTAEATRTDVGKTDMGLAPSQFTNTNTNFGTVTFNVTDGYQEIKPIDVTVTIKGHTNTTDYDGAEHTVTGYDVTISNPLYTEADFEFSGTAEAKRTDIGKTNMNLAPEQFTNTNTNFGTVTFNVTDGYQEIKPIDITVTIVGKNSEVDYDGEEHSVEGYDVTISNPLYTTDDFTFNGNDEAKRTDAGTSYMGLKRADFENTNRNFENVTFIVTDGYQKIKPVNVEVTITGNNHSDPYDGTDHTVTGYTATSNNPLYKVSGDDVDFTFSGTASATQKDVGKKDMGLASNQFENKNPNFGIVTFNVTDGYQEITPIDVTVTIVGNNHTDVYDSREHTVTGYEVTSISSSLYTENDFTFNGDATAARTDVGTTNMGLKASDFVNNNDNFGTVTFNITDGYQTITKKGEVVVTITGKTSSVPYDGEEHTITGYDVQISDPLYTVEDFTFSGTASAKRTDAGKTDMGLTETQFTNTNPNFDNVTFNVTDGYQEITPINVTVDIKGTQASHDYDGEEHVATGYTVTNISSDLYTENDFDFNGTAEAKRTNVGTTDMGLKASDFENKNPNFAEVTFNVTDGYQKITPISVTVTITGAQVSEDYDGNMHTAEGYFIKISDPLYKEADFTFSGTKTVSRDTVGTTNMHLAADQFTNINDNFANVNFVIADDGYVEVKPIDVTVTIVGHNSTDQYDGAEHTVSGYDVTISNPLYTVNDFTFAGTAEAKRTDAGKTDMGLTPGKFTNTNTNFGNVTFNVTDGYQEITPIDGVTVTITGKTSTLPYDGAEHTVSGYEVEISNPLYTVDDFSFNGTASASQQNVGKKDMGLTPANFTNTSENFTNVTFNVTDGYQEITPIDVTVTIVGNNHTDVYDSQEHTVTGYEVTSISSSLYTENDFTFNGDATAARTDVGTTNMGLKASDFVNNNDNFGTVTFNITDGYQTITEKDKVVVTITGKTSTVPYDGEEHTITGYDVQISDPLYTVDDFSFDGTAEAKRTDVGSTPMGLTPDQFTNDNPNFKDVTFEVVDGYQAVTAIDVTVTITGSRSSLPYDGENHSVTGYTATSSNPLYKVSGEDVDFTFDGTAVASRTEAGKTDMGLAPEQFTNKNPNFGNVTFVVGDGYQEITPIDVTVTIIGHNSTLPYDGEEHTVTGYDVSFSTPLYTEADFGFTGTATATQQNVGTANMGLAQGQFQNKNDNFKTVTFAVTDGYQTITPIAVTVTIVGENDTTVYDGNPHTVTGYTATASSNLYDVDNDLTFGGTAEATRTDAGKTDMDLKETQFQNTNDNFTVTFDITDGYQEITKATMSVTAVDYAGTYDGDSHSGGASVSVSDGTTVQYSTDGGQTWTDDLPSIKDVGTVEYMVKATNPNYEDATDEGKLEVTKATVTVTAENKAKKYGEDDPKLTAAVVGVVDGYEIEYDLSRDPGENVGTYTITPSGLEEQGNYTVVYETGTLTISKADAFAVTAIDAERDYNGQPLEGGITGDVPDGTTIQYSIDGGQTWTADPPSITNVGTVEYTVKATNPNYEDATDDGKLEITPKEVTVQADNKTKVYGEDDPTWTATVTGMVDGESAEELLDFDFGRESGENVGKYEISVSGDEFQGNYKVNYESGELEITPADMEVVAEGYSGTYDGQSHTPTVAPEVTEGTTVEYSTDGGQTWSQDVPSIKDVGEETVKIRVTNDNYNTVEKEVTLEVTPAEVTVRANNSSKVFGADDPEFSAEVTGVVDGFKIEYDVTRPGAGTDESVGYYEAAIIPAGDETQGNYTVKYEPGDFEITKSTDLKVTTTDFEGTYDGKPHSGDAVANITDGTTIYYSTDGGKTWTTEKPTIRNVSDGEITVQVKAENDNYETAYGEFTMKLSPKELVIRTGSATKVYDGKPLKNKDASITGLADGDSADIEATGSRTKVGSSTNTYSIDWGNTDPANYKITKHLGTLKVKPKDNPDPTPTPPGPVNPTPNNPDPIPPTVITDDPVPQTVIDDQAVPKAPVESYWALINLICAIITALLSLIMLIGYLGKRREEDEETGESTEIKKKGAVRLASIIPAIGAIIAFILTEDMSGPWTWVDKWTILMVVILAIQVIVAIFAKKKTDDQDGTEPESAA